jgi:uncharacterized protein YjiS (DUF1127 family)
VSVNATAMRAGSRQIVSRPRFRGIVRNLVLMLDAWRTRRILAEMDPWQLKDIGVSRSDALAEVARAPWDIGPRR